jgi:CheY-like chemotaxis protein
MRSPPRPHPAGQPVVARADVSRTGEGESIAAAWYRPRPRCGGMKDGSTSSGSQPPSFRGEFSSKPTLLVVDDDPEWREALRSWLEDEAFRVVMLARPEWVTHAIELHRPDVVVLDVNLPGGNGLDILAAVGRRWPSLPVIIMTAFGGPGIGETARRLGAIAYLEKPFRVPLLVEEIRQAATRGHGNPKDKET